MDKYDFWTFEKNDVANNTCLEELQQRTGEMEKTPEFQKLLQECRNKYNRETEKKIDRYLKRKIPIEVDKYLKNKKTTI